MQVSTLLELMKTLPPDAHVVIGGDVIHSVEIRKGKIEVGYYGPVFRECADGREKALVFMHNSELSTGDVISSPK